MDDLSDLKEVLWLSPRRFAATAKMPLPTVYDYVRKGRIPHARRGGRIWIESFHLDNLDPTSPLYGHIWEVPKGVVPRKYRNERGELLPEVEVPRSELLWGTAGENLERSYALANSGNDLRHADRMPGYVVVQRDRGLIHRALY